MRKIVVSLLLAGLACCGCNEPKDRVNTPLHGPGGGINDMQGTLVYMSDNALLADMSMSDMHFYPHRPRLNEVGQERLCRLISLIEAYGGAIRFSSSVEDENLSRARLQTVTSFMQDAGLNVTAENLTEGLPGGRGMDAPQAIMIKLNEGSYIPPKKAGGASGGGPPLYNGGGGSGGKP